MLGALQVVGKASSSSLPWIRGQHFQFDPVKLREYEQRQLAKPSTSIMDLVNFVAAPILGWWAGTQSNDAADSDLDNKTEDDLPPVVPGNSPAEPATPTSTPEPAGNLGKHTVTPPSVTPPPPTTPHMPDMDRFNETVWFNALDNTCPVDNGTSWIPPLGATELPAEPTIGDLPADNPKVIGGEPAVQTGDFFDAAAKIGRDLTKTLTENKEKAGLIILIGLIALGAWINYKKKTTEVDLNGLPLPRPGEHATFLLPNGKVLHLNGEMLHSNAGAGYYQSRTAVPTPHMPMSGPHPLSRSSDSNLEDRNDSNQTINRIRLPMV